MRIVDNYSRWPDLLSLLCVFATSLYCVCVEAQINLISLLFSFVCDPEKLLLEFAVDVYSPHVTSILSQLSCQLCNDVLM